MKKLYDYPTGYRAYLRSLHQRAHARGAETTREERNERSMTDKPTFNDQLVTRIQIIGYEWFDKINGNSYCSARIYVNDEPAAFVPFQYGHGSAYVQYAAEALNEAGIITMKSTRFGGLEPLWQYCSDRDIELLSSLMEHLKRDTKAWGKRDDDGSEQ